MKNNSQSFSQRLLRWFATHGRHDLPWQQEITPYRVWVSEIMLQQTRVSTVLPYFNAFMQQFPTINDLAAASQDEVLHLWTGLGYYARARNLHKAAMQIVERHGNRMPESMEDLQALPGVGRSTAGAILAIACDQRQPILDGNVRRVLARHRDIAGWPGKAEVLRQLWQVAEDYTPRKRVAAYTQAIMDLGATVCIKSRPLCESCPVADDCIARMQGRQDQFPGRKPQKTLPVRKTVFVILENSSGRILLQKRPVTGIWGGLWSFPEVESPDDIENVLLARLGYTAVVSRQLPPMRHTFSHYHLDILPVHVHVEAETDSVADNADTTWYAWLDNPRLGMAAPVKSLLQQLNNSDTGDLHGQDSTLRQAGQGG